MFLFLNTSFNQYLKFFRNVFSFVMSSRTL